jgi:hypothetical protein
VHGVSSHVALEASNETAWPAVGEAGAKVYAATGWWSAGGGGAFWMVQVCEAGEASVLPAASVARTLKLCEPTARPL